MTSNNHLRVQPLEPLHGLLRDLRSATEEKDSVTLFRRPIDQHWYEISACDTFWKWITEKPGGPKEGCSVTERKVRFHKDSAQLDIFEGLDAEVHVSSNHIMRFTAGHHVVYAVEGFRNGEVIKGNAQQCGGQLCRAEVLLDYRRCRCANGRGVFGDDASGSDLLIGPHGGE